MPWYVDASIVVHAVLPWGDERAPRWLDSLTANGDTAVSSTLLLLEVTRALRRERLDVSLARAVTRAVEVVSIDDDILRAAGAIEPHVKSLDAIHLATCQLLGANVTVATHDTAMQQVAQQLGFETFDPLA